MNTKRGEHLRSVFTSYSIAVGIAVVACIPCGDLHVALAFHVYLFAVSGEELVL